MLTRVKNNCEGHLDSQLTVEYLKDISNCYDSIAKCMFSISLCISNGNLLFTDSSRKMFMESQHDQSIIKYEILELPDRI